MRTIMPMKSNLLAASMASAAIAIALLSAAPAVGADQTPGCAPADRIDGSSIETVRGKIQKAGYSKVENLKKGCDNFWHGTAIKDGQTIHLVLTPKGQVLIEGN